MVSGTERGGERERGEVKYSGECQVSSVYMLARFEGFVCCLVGSNTRFADILGRPL